MSGRKDVDLLGWLRGEWVKDQIASFQLKQTNCCRFEVSCESSLIIELQLTDSFRNYSMQLTV